jgi:tetratricopeptide (TPR) repeat protein
MLVVVSVASASELFAIYSASAEGAARAVGLTRAAKLSPFNWRYPQALAGLEGALGNHEAALRLNEQALAEFRACDVCWVGVAEAQAAVGSDASEALDNAIHYGRSEGGVRLRAAIVLSKLGEEDEAAREFSAALGGMRDDTDGFYVLMHRLYPASYVLDRIVTDDDLATYFPFARQALDPTDVMRVWERFRDREEADEQRPAYVSYLLRHGYARAAWEVAFGRAGRPPGTVVDGGFEKRTDKENLGGLGWRIEDGEGVRADIVTCSDCETGQRALRLRFDGEHNVHYLGAAQTVAVEPGGHYVLKAKVRYEDLTSAHGPAINVIGLAGQWRDPSENCRLQAKTEEFRHSNGWRSTQVEFDVPENCEGIRIIIARPRVRELNRFIGGELWVDDVSLELLAHAPTEPAEDTPEEAAGAPDGTDI